MSVPNPIGQLTRDQMIEMMVARSLDQEFPKQAAEIGSDRLVVTGLARGRKVRDVSFSIRAGEILGLTGLVGAGRTEVRASPVWCGPFGAWKYSIGTVERCTLTIPAMPCRRESVC